MNSLHGLLESDLCVFNSYWNKNLDICKENCGTLQVGRFGAISKSHCSLWRAVKPFGLFQC